MRNFFGFRFLHGNVLQTEHCGAVFEKSASPVHTFDERKAKLRKDDGKRNARQSSSRTDIADADTVFASYVGCKRINNIVCGETVEYVTNCELFEAARVDEIVRGIKQLQFFYVRAELLREKRNRIPCKAELGKPFVQYVAHCCFALPMSMSKSARQF